jgi:DNA-binding protein YbaB
MQRDDLPNVGAARALAEEMQGKLKKLLEDGPKLRDQARLLQVTEKSKDGLITVTVGSSGQLIRLDIDPRIYRRPDARALADAITDTIKRAGTKAQDRVVELFAPLIPRDQMQAHLSGDRDAIQEQMRKQMRGES